MFGGCVAISRSCRRYSQDRLELNKQIAQSTVSQAGCNFPEDREFIKAVITCLYSETLNEIDGNAAFELRRFYVAECSITSTRSLVLDCTRLGG
ncbi:unnamed protein product [Polarella glacialis]|uniref:Uncharacterized protein n=1 Tax=Polarella glacialis TaxID=89957 RepID=A0A813GCI6_POLGL|nr:unnamed protein product [Polarella glacialis]